LFLLTEATGISLDKVRACGGFPSIMASFIYAAAGARKNEAR